MLSRRSLTLASIEADTAPGTQEERENKALVNKLYNAIAREDVATLQSCLSPELDWWYHGPPGHQHMKFLLTGVTRCKNFAFNPIEIWVIANRVFVEGHGKTPTSYWIHIWGVKDNLFVVLREYYNTAIMVTNVAPSRDGSDTRETLWQSSLARNGDKNIPGLVLAIDVNR